jgi:hypothetical protein
MRTIIEEDSFRQSLKKLGISPKRLDELVEGVIFAVAKSPETFPEVPGTGIHRLQILPFPGMKRLNVWFTFEDETVTFLGVDDWSL